MITASEIADNLELARERIARALEKAGDSGRAVRIMAVTKTHTPQTVLEVLEAGVTLLGENRISEGGRKVSAVGKDAAEWHMIGPIHRSEVRRAIRDFHSVDSIDRIKLLNEIARRTASPGSTVPGLLLEVNTSGEESKHGFDPDRGLLEGVIGSALDLGLDMDGLFTVGPLGGGEAASRRAFGLLRELRNHLEQSCSLELPELSMGMSDDFEEAVMEGATTVRLGRFLLGPRRR